MTSETLNALNESIKHWENMALNGCRKQKPVEKQCALCLLFLDSSYAPQEHCIRCPVCQKTGRRYCENTPYRKAYDLYRNNDEQLFKLAAQEEVDFLKSLLK